MGMSLNRSRRCRLVQLVVVRSQHDLGTAVAQVVLDEGGLDGDRVQGVADGNVRGRGEEEDHRRDAVVLDHQFGDDAVRGDEEACGGERGDGWLGC